MPPQTLMDQTAVSSAPLREYLFKVLVVGDIGTGKTSIIKRYVHGIFSNHYKATIGVDFALKVLNLGEDVVVRLQLWDIAGQERFGNMTRVYYKEAVGAIIVFDVTRVSTFEAVQKWKNDIDNKVAMPNGDKVPVVLLANKCDMAKEGLVRNSQQMDKYCEEKGFIGWFETSAKDNLNINDACQFLVHKIIENDQGRPEPDPKEVNIVLGKKKKEEEASGGGCC
eukprot:m.11814 g.11814  ORF g.11814 m.11814 type:complete len:224 (+) comp6590_c0_seq1:205-876(+)